MQPSVERRSTSRKLPIVVAGILVLCLCLICLMGGGGAGYWFILRPATQTAEALLRQAQAAQTEAARPTKTPRPTATEESQPLRLAILAPLSGIVPTFGESVRDGALLAVEEWNARGGVLGRQIEAIVEDSQCDAQAAVEAANKVINQDGVHYIIGEVCSRASIPVSEIAEANGVVQISPASANALVTVGADGTTKRFVFRACVVDPFQGTSMAKFALQQGYYTAFLMSDPDNIYSSQLSESFKAAFVAGGGVIVGIESYTASDTDFTTILTKVSESHAEVLYLPDFYTTANLVGAQARDLGVEAVLMGGDGWDSTDLDLAAVAGGYYTSPWVAFDPTPAVQAWIEAYQSRYGKAPDALAALAYDSVNVMLTAIQDAGVDDPDLVRQALERLTYQSTTGVLRFDPQHNPVRSVVIVHITDGQQVYGGTVNP